MNTLHPRPEHKFSFGLWTAGHPGRDPFGDVVCAIVGRPVGDTLSGADSPPRG